MKVIRNTSHRPLRISLSQGKTLHLGPGKEGQIATQDADRKSVQDLVAEGAIEIVGEGSGHESTYEETHVNADTHGHHPNQTVKKRGER